MICPICRTHIPEGSVVCPACHANVGLTVAMPAVQGRWCPACGAGVGWEDEVCPSCGLPLEREWTVTDDPVEALPRETVVDQEARTLAPAEEDTHAMARIESAIPPEDDPTSKVAAQEEMPHTGRLVVAAIASVLLVGGLALSLAHPWRIDDNSINPEKEADTSMAGFPGTVETLSGQDSNGSKPSEELSGDDATYAQLEEIYGKLGRYSARADDNEALFVQLWLSPNLDDRLRGKREAEALAIDISNLIAQTGTIDVTSGTYAPARDSMLTLASWLRNRVDRLAQAWRTSADAADPTAEQERILAVLNADNGPDGQNTYKSLFAQHYEGSAPVHLGGDEGEDWEEGSEDEEGSDDEGSDESREQDEGEGEDDG